MKPSDDIGGAMPMMGILRDPFSREHAQRVGNLAAAIAAEMKLGSCTQEGLRIMGRVHDLGTIAIPAEILNKPKGLTQAEYALVRTHSEAGYDIVGAAAFQWPVATAVLQHHERMDGSGYPKGIKGREIIIEARILAVADVVEAMASHRPHRPPLGIKAALDEIDKNAGVLYDSVVGQACLRLFKKGYKLH